VDKFKKNREQQLKRRYFKMLQKSGRRSESALGQESTNEDKPKK